MNVKLRITEMQLEQDFHNKIASISLEQFRKLPKTGKPSGNEWTVLSAIVKEDSTKFLEVVALGTGSKCIGKSSMSKQGDTLNDSHAEVICRRSFLHYLYYEIDNTFQNKSSIFTLSEDRKCLLKPDMKFHFFSTHVPCGDAAIFPKQIDEDVGKQINMAIKRPLGQDEDNSDSSCKILKTSDDSLKPPDIHRTGGKCLPNEQNQDPLVPGNKYHSIGVVRTKPGRGDPTLSVSCSDKLAKWTFLGIQGALISLFLHDPIYLASFTVAGNIPYSFEALSRALHDRFQSININSLYHKEKMLLGQAQLSFEHAKDTLKRPCPTSIIWSRVSSGKVQVTVEGKKQGLTNKNLHTKKARVSICKIELFRIFSTVLKNSGIILFEEQEPDYLQAKMKATCYQESWKRVKVNCFKVWTQKDPELLKFKLD